jgi:hypothetical protein
MFALLNAPDAAAIQTQQRVKDKAFAKVIGRA